MVYDCDKNQTSTIMKNETFVSIRKNQIVLYT